MGEERTCLNCGKPFIPTCHITRQKYCSDNCRIRYNNAKRYYSEVPVNVCPECGEPIQQSGGAGRWRRFCSSRCKQLYHYKKNLEKRMQRWEAPKQICPNCGIEFQPEWGPGKQRRFCSDTCRVTWWGDYHRANPTAGPQPAWCAYCGRELTGDQKKYCSRECYRKAMEETHEERVCQWCGDTFSTYTGGDQRYCSRTCATAAMSAPNGYQRGRHRIPAGDKESWHKRLTEATRNQKWDGGGKQVILVCGATSMYTGLDGLAAIVQYRLKRNPYNGSIYVFRDSSGTMLKYIEWDGQSFCQGKRRAQSGTYPWPNDTEGETLEISEREFRYLLSDSIPPFKEKK